MSIFNFDDIFLIKSAETRSISAENPQGEKGKGGMAVPDKESPAYELGQGWKVKPCITLPAGKTVTLADIKGPGVISHIWITVKEVAYRSCILRFFWDEEENPSVEVPLGDFFVNGFGKRYNVNSLPIVVNPQGGFNCYFPMPFKKRAKITVENQHWEDIEGFFYQITYLLKEIPENSGYFHAQWRRSMTKREYPEHIIVDGIKGKGHYVGTVLFWTQLSDGWWGEGEVKFYIDGDKEFPTICGTGTEDYFGGAWGFGGQTYSTPFLGYPFQEKEPGKIPKHTLYRWHIPDPINFKESLKVTVQALGWWPNHKFQPLTDDIASVAYWYQEEPHNKFPELPEYKERFPR